MLAIGIDPGLAATGLAVIDVDGDSLLSTQIARADDRDLIAAIRYITWRIIGPCNKIAYDLSGTIVGIEEPVYGRNVASIRKQAMLVGALVCALSPAANVIMVNNKSAKKYYAGSGNATKDDMVAETIRRYGPEYETGPKYRMEAIADAIAIALTAAHMAG